MLFNQENTTEEIWQMLRHELNRGALDPKHAFRYLNLGTFGQDYPEVRTVVLRKVDEELNFYIYTDQRSDKVQSLVTNPNACLHFYHPKKRVQVRVQAKCHIHHLDEVAGKFWNKIQGDAQKAYTSQLAPGSVIHDPREAWTWPEEKDERFFAVLLFRPISLEALQLDGLNHLRIHFSKADTDWVGEWLVP
ncbi:pyridoxamine 5'-phosphate oxidase family protein [Algoriphagus namhaensis]